MKRRIEFLKSIISMVDYDIYKGMFEFPEEPEEMARHIESLEEVVEEYENEIANLLRDKT